MDTPSSSADTGEVLLINIGQQLATVHIDLQLRLDIIERRQIRVETLCRRVCIVAGFAFGVCLAVIIRCLFA